MRILITAIHGILTDQTDPSWPDKFDAWMFQRDPGVKVLKKEYRAGPFPRWNCWIKDPLLARSLANELELFLRPQPSTSNPQLWFVAHSNGAVIALLTAGLLINRGFNIGGLILTGAACEADIERNEVLQWRCRGMLGSAIAYSSAEDEVLPESPALDASLGLHSFLLLAVGQIDLALRLFGPRRLAVGWPTTLEARFAGRRGRNGMPASGHFHSLVSGRA